MRAHHEAAEEGGAALSEAGTEGAHHGLHGGLQVARRDVVDLQAIRSVASSRNPQKPKIAFWDPWLWADPWLWCTR